MVQWRGQGFDSGLARLYCRYKPSAVETRYGSRMGFSRTTLRSWLRRDPAVCALAEAVIGRPRDFETHAQSFQKNFK